MKKGAAQQGGSPYSRVSNQLLVQAAADVREDVLYLVTKDTQNDDNNHCDENENQGVFNHALAFFTSLSLYYPLA